MLCTLLLRLQINVISAKLYESLRWPTLHKFYAGGLPVKYSANKRDTKRLVAPPSDTNLAHSPPAANLHCNCHTRRFDTDELLLLIASLSLTGALRHFVCEKL